MEEKTMLGLILNLFPADVINALPHTDLGAAAGFVLATSLKKSANRILKKLEKAVIAYIVVILGIFIFKMFI